MGIVRRCLPTVMLLTGAFLVAAPSGWAQIQSITEIPVPTADGSPYVIATGPDASLWFNDAGIGRICTAGSVNCKAGEFEQSPANIPLCRGAPGAAEYIAWGPDGNLWFTNVCGLFSMSPVDGTIKPYPVSPAIPLEITTGPWTKDNANGVGASIWFTASKPSSSNPGQYTGVVGYLGKGGAPRMYDVPSPGTDTEVYGITMGSDGNLWFVFQYASASEPNYHTAVAYINPHTGIFRSSPITLPVAANTEGESIAGGSDGALWVPTYGNTGINAPPAVIWRVATSGEVTPHPTPTAAVAIQEIAPGPDGALWFTETPDRHFGRGPSGRIGRISLSDGAITETEVPNSIPVGITAGPDGNVWFTDACCSEYPVTGNNAIGQVVLGPNPRQPQPRPIQMGVSIGNVNGPTGTAGMLVQDTLKPGRLFILGNNHVLGEAGPKRCYDTAAEGLTKTVQPGPGDAKAGGGGVVGTVARFFPVTQGAHNLIDAALSETDASLADPRIFGIGAPAATIGTAKLGEAVVKSGKTTGLTVGVVTAVNVTPAPIKDACGQYTFYDQIAITGTSPTSSFATNGDSGAVILDQKTLEPVGLLKSGTGEVTFASLMSNVGYYLGVVPAVAGAPPATTAQLRGMEEAWKETADPRVERLKPIQERHTREVLGIAGVQGIGIGLADDRQDAVFIVFVARRSPALTAAIPAELGDVPVEIAETGGEVRDF